MATIVTCKLAAGETWRPDPFPGSKQAVAAGCTCPAQPRINTVLRFSSDCPVHELENLGREH